MTAKRPANPPASPACFADEASDVYMGFASREEIAESLKAVDDAEAAGRFRDAARLLDALLPKVRDDRLHQAYRERLDRLNAQGSVT